MWTDAPHRLRNAPIAGRSPGLRPRCHHGRRPEIGPPRAQRLRLQPWGAIRRCPSSRRRGSSAHRRGDRRGRSPRSRRCDSPRRALLALAKLAAEILERGIGPLGQVGHHADPADDVEGVDNLLQVEATGRPRRSAVVGIARRREGSACRPAGPERGSAPAPGGGRPPSAPAPIGGRDRHRLRRPIGRRSCRSPTGDRASRARTYVRIVIKTMTPPRAPQ
jgi:hypothetical protein